MANVGSLIDFFCDLTPPIDDQEHFERLLQQEATWDFKTRLLNHDMIITQLALHNNHKTH